MTFAKQTRIGISKQRGFWLRYFLGARLGGCLVLAALSTASAAAQAVCISGKHRPCTASESKEMQDEICRDELAPANLFLLHPVRLTGTFLDPSGAPLDFDSIKPGHHTIAQIKSLVTGAILYAVPVHSNGEFEFEAVPEGSYRLILVWMQDGKFNRLPLVDQPKELRCEDLKECTIKTTISFHGTDEPTEFCPPK